jgi:DNA polymerase I-like protein with 3'-5' exonuclease and polymerase domains
MSFPELSRFPHFALDFETTGLHFWKDKIFGVAVSTPDDRDYYFDTRSDPGTLEWLRREMPRCAGKARWINHNIKFDAEFALAADIDVPLDDMDCTMVRAALIDEHRLTYDLDSLGKDYVGIGKMDDIYEELAKLFGGAATKSKQIVNLHRAPKSLAGKYAKQDTRTALKLWLWQEREIQEQNLGRVAELERQLMPVLIAIEMGGVRVDLDASEKAAKDIDVMVNRTQKELDRLAGFPVNPNPSGSIHKLFEPKKNEQGIWLLNDGTVAESTPAGKASISADCLRQMKHPAAAMILKLRKAIKTRDTFIRGHILSYHNNGLIHANYNQTKTEDDVGTGTGRLSVNAPALQQIPARDKDIASVVRALFLPDAGQDWCCNDWAQMDFRMMAHYVNNRVINKAYAENADTDFHSLAADLTGLPRSPRYAGDANAKQINLGLVFGMGMGKLAYEMGLPYTVETYKSRGVDKTWMKPGSEAEAVFEKYHENIPGVKAMLSTASSIAKDRGYVMTILGRHIRFPGGRATHKAGGLIFQGSAADALKQKLVEVHREISGTDSRLLMNVHDEFDLSVPKARNGTPPPVLARVKEIITTFDGESTPIKFRVPIRADQQVGPNWWIASK